MNEGVIYWKSKKSGKMGHGNITSLYINHGVFRSVCTTQYFIPVSHQIRKIYNQD